MTYVLLILSTSIALPQDNPEQTPLTNPFTVSGYPGMPLSMGMLPDTMLTPRGWYTASYGEREVEIYIDRDWSMIVLTEYVNGQVVKMPFVSSMDSYFNTMMTINRQKEFIKHINAKFDTQEEKKEGRSQSIEVVGLDLGGLGRASLRVRGNVNISGKMVFQDQQLVAASIKEQQNTHLEFDQKQNLNIEGKIGDRITVKMDQDSERDFDWENNIRITYDGHEDDIVQKIEAGNISLSLPATQFVTFSGSNKGLFGLKAISKLGPVDITTIASIEQTKKEQQEYKGDNQEKTTVIKDNQYVKDQHFLIHEWFRYGITSNKLDDYTGQAFEIEPFYPLSANGLHFVGDVKITDFELYKSSGENVAYAKEGVAYTDAFADTSVEKAERFFVRMERDIDYYISEDYGYLRLNQRATSEVIACRFNLVYRDGASNERVVTIGSETDSTLVLKLIKPQNSSPTSSTWDLMLKNVYYLGTSNINQEGFALRIVSQLDNPPSDRNGSGTTYISLFGLDTKDKNGNQTPDEIVDIDNPNIISLSSGELFFPYFYPFASGDSLDGGNTDESLGGKLGKGLMYTSTTATDVNKDNNFNIEVDYSNQSSTISLGFMLVEGSEEITINGAKQTRGVDYQIDYFTGTIILQSEASKDPNANINILYDKHELVSFDKKVIVGTRAQMDINENSFLGATALYFNQSVIDEKVEVGYEPTRNFIWDVNGRYQYNMDGLTRWLDRLPIIEAEKTSAFSVEGEIAQVLPNPNPINNTATGDPEGVAFIDDFEGSKRTTNPSILRRYWKKSSSPVRFDREKTFRHLYRANMWWYNPYQQILTKDIWPNQSTSIQAGNETTDILTLNMKQQPHQVGLPSDSLWSGITTAFYSGDYDQTKSKFFEIWVKGNKGNLTVDIGKISEDQDGNGKLNTEDKADGLPKGNGLLEEDEDTGLDGCFDEFEDGWGGCLVDTTFEEYLAIYNATGNAGPINPDAEVNDPNGDNWQYTSGSSNYEKINGTEGNGTGSQIQEGGRYPDTEDLDRSGFLDKENDYFTANVDLSDTTYLAGITVKNGNPTGWKLYRIPLTHFRALNNVTWGDVHNLRLVWSGVDFNNPDETAWLRIAKVEMVGNEWVELGITELESNRYNEKFVWEEEVFNGETGYDTVIHTASADSVFAVTVVNTEDNAHYKPPKGVKGEYDPINQLESKEQSLVLQFNGLPAEQKGAAQKTLLNLSGDRAKSYLTYDRMKMYVYGDSDWITSDETDVDMFIQFGLGENYYELIQPVYDGWDEDKNRNSVNIDLNWLTSLKIQDSTNVDKIRSTDIFLDSSNVKHYLFTDENGELTGKKITIVGEPAIQRSKYFTVGVRNRANEPIFGEVWLDELRLSGVKKDKGVAMRVQSKMNLSDLGSATVMYSRRDADFHVLQERLGSNNTKEDFRVNTSLNLSKFLPKSLGVRIPLTTSYANSTSRPKYIPGSDIYIAPESVPDSIKTLSENISLSTSISKTGKSDNKWIKYTLDNLKGDFSASRKTSSNEILEYKTDQSYTWKGSYNLNFGRDNYFTPLSWLSFIPMVGDKFEEFNLYYTPSSFNANANLNEKISSKKPRNAEPTPHSYDLGLNRSMGLDHKFTESLSSNYKQTQATDLDHVWSERGYSWDIKEFDTGILTNLTENLSTQFNPELFSWLQPRFSHSANYRWNKPLGSNIDGANIGTQLRFNSNLNLNLISVMETFYKPTSKSKPASSGRRRRRANTEQVKPAESQATKKKDSKVLQIIHSTLKKVDPINLTYTQTLSRTGNGVQGDVPIGYKFGWIPEHGLAHAEGIETNTGNWENAQDFSIRSGIRPINNLSLSFSFGQMLSQGRSGSGVEQWSFNRDYLGYGKNLSKGLPFSSWSIKINGLEKLPFIKNYVRSISFDHAYSGKESRAWQFADTSQFDMPSFWYVDPFIEDNEKYQRSSKINTNFAPLAGLTFSFKKGISLNMRYNTSTSLDQNNTGLTHRTESSFTAGANYSHRGGLTIPLPLMEDFHIDNTMNFTFNFDSQASAVKGKTLDAPKYSKPEKNSSWKAGLRISYSFTTRVSGGIVYEYRESDNAHTGRKIDRDFGFDVNIAITG